MMPQMHLNSISALQPKLASSSVAVPVPPVSVQAPQNPPYGECARSWFTVGAVTTTAAGSDQPNHRHLTPTEIGNQFSPVTLPFSSGTDRRAMTAATVRRPRPVSMSPPATSTLRTNVDDEIARHPGAPPSICTYVSSLSGGGDLSPLPSHTKERDISNDETPKVANKKRKQRSPSSYSGKYITDVPLPFTSDPAMTADAAAPRPRPVPMAPPASLGTDASDTSVRRPIAPPVGRNKESSSGGVDDLSPLPSITKKRGISTSSSNNDNSKGAHRQQKRPASPSSFALYADLPHGFFGGNKLGSGTSTTAKITVNVNTEVCIITSSSIIYYVMLIS